MSPVKELKNAPQIQTHPLLQRWLPILSGLPNISAVHRLNAFKYNETLEFFSNGSLVGLPRRP